MMFLSTVVNIQGQLPALFEKYGVYGNAGRGDEPIIKHKKFDGDTVCHIIVKAGEIDEGGDYEFVFDFLGRLVEVNVLHWSLEGDIVSHNLHRSYK